jgi:EARP and GARP complex-interacting protein 1
MASCGDDCKVRFWDIRKTNECLKTLNNHSHWVWSVRYNAFHDQLLLTCSSDNRVVLSSIPSLSSEPFKTHLDEENPNADENKHIEPDRVVKIYEEHEDSVYTVEWSSVEPWIFGSLSYDGRFFINKVPKAEKYKILL